MRSGRLSRPEAPGRSWKWSGAFWLALGLAQLLPAGQVPRVAESNLTFTLMAANLTDNPERYEEPGIRILQALKPDIVAIQEFRYAGSTPADLRAFVDLAFGTNFQFCRESSSYAIPNGIISRWPIMDSGSWDDPQVPDRGFAWARIALPGTNDLYLVSVHLHSNGGPASRLIEANVIRSNILASFPAEAWVVVAGDLNTGTRNEAALATFRSFLSDFPIPTDAATGGNDATNKKRTKPYDYVLPSFSLTNRLVPLQVGGLTFPNGLVFDSAVFATLNALPPVQADDSTNCQHMAVVKAFRIQYSVTNWIEAAPPNLTVVSNRLLRWSAPSQLSFRLQFTSNLGARPDWTTLDTTSSSATNYFFTLPPGGPEPRFYRVICP